MAGNIRINTCNYRSNIIELFSSEPKSNEEKQKMDRDTFMEMSDLNKNE